MYTYLQSYFFLQLFSLIGIMTHNIGLIILKLIMIQLHEENPVK